MKKILILSLVFSTAFLAGCGNRWANRTSQDASSTTDTNATSDFAAQDFWPYQGKEYAIGQTKDLYDFTVTLDKITIGNQNFGKYEDGYATIVSTGYCSQRIIGEFTVTAKFPTNLSTLQFSIARHKDGWGGSYAQSVREGKLSTGAVKFGFFQEGLDVPMTGKETKQIKVIIPLLDQFSGHGPYSFKIADFKYATDTTDKRREIEFDLSQYLTY